MARRVFILTILLCALAGPTAAGPIPDTDRAADILRQAREALGGETQLGAVRSLVLSGSLRRMTEDQDIDGRIELSLLLPDKFRRDETIRVMGSDGPTIIAAWDGTGEWRDVKTDALAGGVQIVRRTAPPPAGAAGAPARPAMPMTKADMIRLALATLLTAPASTEVRFAYVGPAETDAGKAEVLDATGPDGFQMRIYFDAQTHRPMAVAYRTLEGPRATFRTMRGGSPPPADQSAAPTPPPPREVDVQLNLGDFRKAGGVLLPYRFEKLVDGKFVEEWSIEKAQVNPSIEASRFANTKK
jgi:hypothetical protein